MCSFTGNLSHTGTYLNDKKGTIDMDELNNANIILGGIIETWGSG